MWGVGRATARKLDARGVKTARGLRDLDDAWVRKHLHTVGLRTVYELRGVSCIPLSRAPRARKTLMRSRTFGAPVGEKRAMREALSTHASAACATLRDEGLAAKAVQIFYHTGRHGPGPHRSVSLALPLAVPTSCTDTILGAVHALLAQSWDARDARGRPFRYKKAGIMLLDLAPSAEAQADLFAPRSPERQKLFETVDALNRRFAGPAMSPALFLAATHLRRPGAPPAWQTQRNHISPRYTTVRADLPVLTV